VLGTCAKNRRYLADFSLALINRTGAYYVCRDIVEELPEFFAALRFWRMWAAREPQGALRKVLGRAMLVEIARMPLGALVPRQRFNDLPTIYFDPLYVLHTQFDWRDIVLCHDVGPVSHPQLFDRSTVELYDKAYRLIQAAKPGMVFVSESSKSEFAKRFGEEYRFMEVIPLYIRTGITGGDAVAPPGVTVPFLLTVDGLEVRKNHVRIIAAFEQSGLRKKGFSYVFCGPIGNSAKDVRTLAERTPGVVGFGYLSDAELRWLYGNACAFVLPSLLEGFGVPPLEAALHGLISIVSHEGAQREAVGDSAILVDPLSVEDIAKGMMELAEMTAVERRRRAARAAAHAKSLSKERYIRAWSDLLSAAQTTN